MIQIQPFYNKKDIYTAFASKENLSFEALELSFFNCDSSVEEWYKASGLTTSIHGAFIDVNPGSGDALIRELSEKRSEQSCISAVNCGAKNVVFHSGCHPFLRGAYLDNWAAKCGEYYAKLAEKYNTNIFIENSMEVDSDPIVALMKCTDTNRVKVCLDIGHVNYSLEPMERWFEKLGDYIGYLHLSDNMGHFDDHLPIGEGSIDWKVFSENAKYLPKNIPVTLEVGGIEGIEKSLRFMKREGLEL